MDRSTESILSIPCILQNPAASKPAERDIGADPASINPPRFPKPPFPFPISHFPIVNFDLGSTPRGYGHPTTTRNSGVRRVSHQRDRLHRVLRRQREAGFSLLSRRVRLSADRLSRS